MFLGFVWAKGKDRRNRLVMFLRSRIRSEDFNMILPYLEYMVQAPKIVRGRVSDRTHQIPQK